MITFTLRMRFDEGPRHEALLVLRSLVGPVRAQTGCTETRLMNDVQATDVITWMSRWREQPDLDHHLQSHHFRRILAVMELAAERPEIEFDSGAGLRGFDLIAEVVGRNADPGSPEPEPPAENPQQRSTASMTHTKGLSVLLAVSFIGATAATTFAAEPPRMKMTTKIPASVTTPDRVETRLGTLSFFDGYPDDATTQKVLDNLDFMRGVEAFLNCMPGASAEGLRTGWATQGADNNQTLLIMETLMDSKSLFLTPNTESVYNMAWLDTRKGPLVIETPPNVLGIVDDHWFRYVGDFGNAGPDKGKGGKFLLLPPGYEGAVPDGYFVLRSRTWGNLMFYRGFLKDGSTKAAVDDTRKFYKVYSLSDADNPPPMKFVNVSGREFNTIHANDFHFYEEVNAIVQSEPNEASDPETLGLLAAIGIEKGREFAPDARMKKILTEAAAVANATSRALTFRPRVEGVYYYPDRRWFTSFAGGSYEFLKQPGVRNLDGRVLFHYYATGITPAMAMKMVGVGSQYAAATTDSEGRPLDGGKTYRIHLPPNIPAQNFWSLVVYDNQTRSMLQTDYQFPSIGSLKEGVVVNADSSVDVWFGPVAPKGHEANWVQTVPGKGWNALLRLYGPGQAWFDKTWKPGDFELAE